MSFDALEIFYKHNHHRLPEHISYTMRLSDNTIIVSLPYSSKYELHKQQAEALSSNGIKVECVLFEVPYGLENI